MKAFKILLPIIFFLVSMSSARATVYTVCSSGCNSNTVQGAINMASNGDSVQITDSGEYREFVVVNRSIELTSTSSPFPTIFNDGPASFGSAVLSVVNGNVSISKINVKYNGTGSADGTMVSGVINVTINNITSTSGGYSRNGIYLVGTIQSSVTNSIVQESYVSSFFQRGIYVYFSSNNTLANNSISNPITSAIYGIYIYSGSNNILSV